MARGEFLFLGLLEQRGVRRAGVGLVVLLLLDAQDVRRALGAGQQVLAVVGVEEFAERLDAADDQEEIVLAFEREHGVDEIVPRALLAELDFEAVGEEGEEIASRSAVMPGSTHPSFEHDCRSSPAMTSSAWRSNSANRRSRSLSSTIRITPSAARRSANGSFEPVGFSSIAQKPTSMSSLSASATAIDTGSDGTRSFGPCGL